MAKKKNKSSNNTSAAVVAEPIIEEESKSKENEIVEEDEDVEEVELLQVDVGDIIKLKQVLDEAVVGTFLEVLNLPEDHKLDNIKLSLMTLACLFAVAAQFAPIPFPESRPLLGICCCAYFLLSGILQFIVSFLDLDAIMITLPLSDSKDAADTKKSKVMKYPQEMYKNGLRIRTNLPRFDEFYTVIIQYQNVQNSVLVKQTWSVGQFFDVEGMFDEIGLMEEIEALYSRFVNGKYDKIENDIASSEPAETKKKK